MGRKLKSIESKINEAQKQLDEAKRELAEYKKTKKLPHPEIGDKIEIADLTWTVLDRTEEGYLCLAERLKESMQFDSNCNNWNTSTLRAYLNKDFCKELIADVGEGNIVPFERDLLSMDGQTEYGTCEDLVSLLTVDEYRKYRKLIPNTNDYWWWTITADTTECNGNDRWIRVVAPAGIISSYCYFNSLGGVRPFCIFKSTIFESEEE